MWCVRGLLLVGGHKRKLVSHRETRIPCDTFQTKQILDWQFVRIGLSFFSDTGHKGINILLGSCIYNDGLQSWTSECFWDEECLQNSLFGINPSWPKTNIMWQFTTLVLFPEDLCNGGNSILYKPKPDLKQTQYDFSLRIFHQQNSAVKKQV